MGENIVRDKSFTFALEVIKLCKYLRNSKEYIISDQVLRCGTSIGANISESTYAQSKKDFVNKLSIALKESCETEYWLKLIKESNLADAELIDELINKVHEIMKLLTSIIKTTKNN